MVIYFKPPTSQNIHTSTEAYFFLLSAYRAPSSIRYFSMGSQQSLYSRLDPNPSKIRLVHNQPGAWDDPILCEIQAVSLDSSPSPIYETLSYTWGDSHVTGPILLGDCVVDVKANLWAALRRFRYASKARVIWIDTLSINQNDIPREKISK
jgi:hypothetical protein